MEKYRNNYNKLDVMKIHDLEDLVYTASMKSARRAEEMLFGGLMPFFNRLFDENEMILEELQYIKTLLQQEQPVQQKELLANAPKLNLVDSLPNVKISDDTLKRLQLAMANNQLKGDEWFSEVV